MAVTKYYKSFDGEDIEVKQSGEVLTDSEESALRQQLGGDFSEVEKPSGGVKTSVEKSIKGTPKIYTDGGRFRGADYKKGVDNNRFRAGFANTNNFNEKVNFLDKSVGKGGYVVDKQQNFLLTPDGQRALGYEPESENLLAIDSDKFEREDFIDLIGEVGAPMLASIAGSYAGMAAAGALLAGAVPALTPFVGFSGLLTRMVLGAGTTGAAAATGTLIDEGQQWMRGISEESTNDIIARAGREAAYGAVGETLGLGISRVIGRGIKGGPKYFSGRAGREADEALRKKYREVLDPKGDGSFEGGMIGAYYGKGAPGENKPITRRMTEVFKRVFDKQTKIDQYNIDSLKESLRTQVGMTDEAIEEIPPEILQRFVGKAANDYRDLLAGDVAYFKDMLGYRIAVPLDDINKKIIAGKNSGMSWYDDLFKHYNELQDYVAVTSTVAFDDAQRRAFQVFTRLKPQIDESLTTLKPPKLTKEDIASQIGEKKFTYPEGFNQQGMPQFKEVNQEVARLEKVISENSKKVNKLKNKKTLSAPEKEIVENFNNDQNSLNYLKGLQSSSQVTEAKQVRDMVLPGEDAAGKPLVVPAFNQITREPLQVLNNADGNAIFAYSLDEANEQIKYILPTNLIDEVQKFKQTFGGGLRLNEGPLKTIYDLPRGASTLMSPTEMNAVVQQMRKISIASDGEYFNPKNIWDAALSDVSVSNAQLSNVGRLASLTDDADEVYKAQLKAAEPVLETLNEYATQVRQITEDNRVAFELFDKTNVTALADQYVAGKANATTRTLFNKVVDGDNPDGLEAFLDAVEKVKRRKDRSIYTGTIGSSLPKNTAGRQGVAATDPKKLPKIDTLSPPSQTARAVFQSEFEKQGGDIIESTFQGTQEGRKIGLQQIPEPKTTPTDIAEQSLLDTNLGTQTERSIRLNQIDQASPEELRELVRNDLYRLWLERSGVSDLAASVDGPQLNLGQFAEDIINKSTVTAENYKGKSKKSVLQMLAGDDMAEEWVSFARTIENSDPEVARQAINIGFKQPNLDLSDASLKELVEGIQDNIRYRNNEIADEFFTNINARGGFRALDTNDVQQFYNNFNSLSGKQISQIVRLIPEKQVTDTGETIFPRQLVRQDITRKLFEPLIEKGTDESASVTKESISRIGEVLGYKANSLKRQANPQFTKEQFNALYKGANTPNPYDVLDDFWKKYRNLPTAGDVGGLIAAGIGATLAGVPLMLLTGGIGVGVAAAVGVKAVTANRVAWAMSDPKFLKTLAEARFPDASSWQLGRKSERWEQSIAAMTHALRNSIREQRDDAERRFAGARMTFEGATESAPNMALGDVIREQGAGVLTKSSALPQVAKAAINTLGGQNSGAYRNLPNVQSFNVDTNIFQELERRKALAGNNPNTQALIDRGR